MATPVIRHQVRLPGLFMLYSNQSGAVLGTIGVSIDEATRRLFDRQQDGSAFPGEHIMPIDLQLIVRADGAVDGFMVFGPKTDQPETKGGQ